VEYEANPSILGIVEKVKHLVEIIEFPTHKQKCIDKLFDLKVQLTNEYLRNGGVEKIPSVNLLNDSLNFSPHNPNTHTSRIKAFMNCILTKHCTPPVLHQEIMTEYESFIQKDIFFDQIKIDTEKQIDELFEKYKNSTDFIFRGQREASWRLYNTMQREWIYNKYEGKKFYASVLKTDDRNRKTKIYL
jgi:hypothetical protein